MLFPLSRDLLSFLGENNGGLSLYSDVCKISYLGQSRHGFVRFAVFIACLGSRARRHMRAHTRFVLARAFPLNILSGAFTACFLRIPHFNVQQLSKT